MAFTALKSACGFTLLLFFHDCISKLTSWSELAWIPDRNSPRTWNNLGWTSGDHLFQPLLDCLPPHYSYALKLLHCCDTLCTKHCTQRNCCVQQGNLRGLIFAFINHISHFSKLAGSCFSSTSTSPQKTILFLCWETQCDSAKKPMHQPTPKLYKIKIN